MALTTTSGATSDTSSVATIKSRWDKLESTKSPYLDRARDCSKLTIPSLIPPVGTSGSTKLPTPYQGLGARAVNNLAAKLLLALLPPNQPCFRFKLDPVFAAQIKQGGMDDVEIEDTLSKMERALVDHTVSSGSRVKLFEVLKLLIVSGNALMFIPPAGGIKVYKLTNYSCKRDPMGNLIEVVTQEHVHPSALPEEIRLKAVASLKSNEELVEVYTRAYVDTKKNQWVFSQECNGEVIPKSEGTFPLDELPYIALRWTAIDGEDYGRGIVEEYYGDLKSLEELTKAIVKGSAAAAKVLFFVRPNGTTRAKDVAESESGDIKTGHAEDVTVLQMQKYADFKIAFETINEITQRIQYAFLLMSSVQRNAERVTAEEVRTLAGELEDSLGGVYSVLAQYFQLPFVSLMFQQLVRQKKLPELPKNGIKPVITTGIEALGRNKDVEKMQMFMQDVSVLGPDVVSKYINIPAYIKKVAADRFIDTDGWIFTEEEVQAREQQMLDQQASSNMMQDAVKGAVPHLTKGMVEGAMNGISPEAVTG